ncbi:MAG: DUF4388 domain-containing protein [Candidatus Eisenbacteria bacterium]|nr:DUF4388 domain-containing protein [Candidatus Eisenbacteria bacterium]
MKRDRHAGLHGSSDVDLQGKLESISLFDVLQFLMINRRTGVLSIDSGSNHYSLQILEGQLQDAGGPALSHGTEALHAALGLNLGIFRFRAQPVPPVGGFDASTDSLLLEAARQMDERGESSAPDTEELAGRQKRAQELAELLSGRGRRTDEASSAEHALDEHLAALDTWGARLYVTPEGRLWLVRPDEEPRCRPEDPEFRESLLEGVLGPRKDRLLDGTGGLVDGPRGELWWHRPERQAPVLVFSRVHRRFPSLNELGLERPDPSQLQEPMLIVKGPGVSGTSRVLGALFQDPDVWGKRGGVLLSPWPLARPNERPGPTFWIPGAGGDCFDRIVALTPLLESPLLVIEPPSPLSAEELRRLKMLGWQTVSGRPEERTASDEQQDGSMLPLHAAAPGEDASAAA